MKEGKQKLIKMMEGVAIEGKDKKVRKSHGQGGGRDSASENEAISGDGKVNKPAKAVGTGAIRPSRLDNTNDARKLGG